MCENQDNKNIAEKAIDEIKESSIGKTILGEDGKFDKEDIDRMAQDVKDSKIGKAILGEDGKFDSEDIERLAGDAKAAVLDAVDKVKNLFNE